jgi:thioredoxin reductase
VASYLRGVAALCGCRRPVPRSSFVGRIPLPSLQPGSGAGMAGSSFATSLPGIFAVGDVRAGSVKRVASSVGEGSVVISNVWEFVNRSR